MDRLRDRLTSALSTLRSVGQSTEDSDSDSNATSSLDAHSSGWGRLLRIYQNQQYGAKIALIGLTVILVVAGIGGVILFETNAVLSQQVEKNTKTQVGIQQNQLNSQIKNLKSDTQSAAVSRRVKNIDPGNNEAIEQALGSRVSAMPRYVVGMYYVSNQSGEYTVRGSAGSVSGQTAGESADSLGLTFFGEKIDSTYLTDHRPAVYTSNLTTVSGALVGDTHMAVVAPIPHRDAGIVTVVNMDMLSAKLQDPEIGRAFITNEHGTVVAATNQSLVGQHAVNAGLVTKPVLENGVKASSYNGGQYAGTITTDEVSYVTGYAAIQNSDFSVFRQVPKKTAFSLQNRIQQLLLLMVGGVILIGGGILTIFGYLTVSDLRRLSNMARTVSKGEADEIVSATRSDEIGVLARSVGAMQESLLEEVAEQEAMNETLNQAVSEYSQDMDAAASGDLTVRLDTDVDVTQLRRLAENFNQMLDQLEGTIYEAMEFSSDVATKSDDVKSGIREIRGASEEVTEATQEISDGAAKQNQMLTDAVNRMDGLAEDIEWVDESASELETYGRQAAEKSREGQRAAQEAAASMEQIDAQTDSSVEQVELLTEQAEEITEIVEFISSVAKDTNQLAINARIEAASAGEAGEGFAVVADEVKQLADETREAADDIQDRLAELQERAEVTATDIRETKQTVEEGVDTVQDAITALEGIADDVEMTYEQVQEIDETTDRQVESAQETVDLVEDAASISEETSSQTQSVAAAAEEQSASIQQISSGVEDFAAEASSLWSLLEGIEVSDEPETRGEFD